MGETPPPRRFFTRRMFVMLAIVVSVLVVVFGIIIGKQIMVAKYMRSMVQTVTVSTTQAQTTMWQTRLQAVGTLHAVEGADLAAEVSGLVTRIGFRAGQDVKKGTLLIQLRDDAERAAADDALRTYRRDVELIKTKAVSQSTYDSALANMKSTRAAVEKKTIRAPFSGRAGIRNVDLGQYVAPGTTLVTLQQLDPIYVDFKVPQQQQPVLKVGGKIELTTDTFPGEAFPGTVIAFDPKVDAETRTVRVRATIRNPSKKLLPGMFATVYADTGRPRKQMTLPQTAITYNTYGNVVFLVKKETVNGKVELVAEQRFVVTGDTRGDQVAILSGVTPKDVVVSAGANKLKNGTVVTINNTVGLPNDSNPHPREE